MALFDGIGDFLLAVGWDLVVAIQKRHVTVSILINDFLDARNLPWSHTSPGITNQYLRADQTRQ